MTEPQFETRISGLAAIAGGVTTTWLAKAFRIPKNKIERYLAGVKPIAEGANGIALYDLPEAAAYIVDPKRDLADYLKTVKPDQLPEKLREVYWNAMLKRQRWEERARHLWRSEDVLVAMSEVFQMIRTTLQILPDDIDRAMTLTPEQRTTLTRVIDGIQDSIHKSLLDYSNGRATPSSLAEVGDEDEEDLI